ncbi:MAG: SEC-C domain-containing protein [Christensenellaceae bacterium]|nr:SEC-C domain-containing protein [Christensenellaceae bacterium]
MALYANWQDLISSNAQNPQFVSAYYGAEAANYEKLLANHEHVYTGKLSDLAKEFEMENVIFMGFIDGINDSLKTPYDLDAIEEDSDIALDVDLEKLYFNMLKAKAKWLYELPQWDAILTEEKRKEITKAYRVSGRAVSEKKVGKNDPCPCGSGKKYKHCCGRLGK